MTGSGNCGAPDLNKQYVERSGQLQIVVAQHQPQRVAELFEFHQCFASVFGPGAAENLDGAGREPNPVLGRHGGPGQQAAQEKQPPHAFIFALRAKVRR